MQLIGRRVSGLLAGCALLCVALLGACSERGAASEEGRLGAGAQAVEGVARQGTVLAGRHHTLAMRADGTAWGWGDNGASQLGDGTTASRWAPVHAVGLTQVGALAAGHAHSLRAGGVWAWGDSAQGQLGTGLSTVRASPGKVW
jgi:hypothetical protein